jgi:DNA-binding protein H-NS
MVVSIDRVEAFLNDLSDRELEIFYENCISTIEAKKELLFKNAFKKIDEIAKDLSVSGKTLIDSYSYFLDSGEFSDTRTTRPKFENPFTGELWSGRGHMPTWMVELIESGKFKSKFDFIIDNSNN